MNHTGNKNIEHKQKQYNDSKHHDSQGSCNKENTRMTQRY